MRRVLNAFLQLIERDKSDSIIIAASNSPKILDQALFWRFDDVLHYQLPGLPEIKQLIENRLGSFNGAKFPLASVSSKAVMLSHAEITQACDDAIKVAILDDQNSVSGNLLNLMLQDRHAAYAWEAK